MARPAKKTAAKSRAAKPPARSPAKKGAAAKSGRKAAATRGRRKQSAGMADWSDAFGTLAGSGPGREILADVFEAVASTLRNQQRAVTRAIEAGMVQVSEATGAAVNAASEFTTGAAELAEAAASRFAETAAAAVEQLRPSPTRDDEKGRGSSRSSKTRRSDRSRRQG